MFNKYSLELVKDAEIPYTGKIDCPSDIAEVLRTMKLHRQPEENLVILALNTKHDIIGYFVVSVGTVNSSLVHPREIFKRLLLCNATRFIMAHNHPSGSVQPSSEDIAATARINEAGKLMGVDLLDHIIVGDLEYTSLRELNLF